MSGQRERAFAAVGALLMVLTVFAPLSLAAPAAAQEASDLALDVEQDDDYEATLTVTANETPVGGANVTVDSNAAVDVYDGEGEYVTDANGTVALPAPEDEIRLTVTVAYENATLETDVVLDAENESDLAVEVEQNDTTGAATVTVTENESPAAGANVSVATLEPNVTYVGAGEYVTDANGTVGLPAPNETVDVRVEATVGNDSAAEVTTLEAPENDPEETPDNETEEVPAGFVPFGQQLNEFVQSTNFSDFDVPRGLVIADFVLSNNPGQGQGPPASNPVFGDDANETDDDDDERGPPEEAGPPDGLFGDDDNETDDEDDANETEDDTELNETDDDEERGPPEDAGPDEDESDDDDEERGPPEDAGPDDDESDEDEDDGDDDERGPPEDAGPDNGGPP